MIFIVILARVIVVSSDCSEYPLPFLSAYCASKAALNVWAQSFRFEVAKYGIHVAIYHPRKKLIHENYEFDLKKCIFRQNKSFVNFYQKGGFRKSRVFSQI